MYFIPPTNKNGEPFIISPSLLRANDQNDSRFDRSKIEVFSFCYHFSWLFNDDFAVLLVGGMKYILMVVLV